MVKKEVMLFGEFFVIILASLLHISIADTRSCIKDHEFLCDSGKCVPITHRCDGEADCGTGDYSDENFCEHNEQLLDEFLVLASTGNKNIYQLDPKTGRINRLLPVNTPNPVAVAIDMENKDIYYTDVSLAVIGKITVDYFGSKAMTIIHTDNTGGAMFDGLAVDHRRKKLYYSNAGEVGSLGEMSTDGSQHRDLMSERGRKPRAVVIDVQNRLLYWTDWGVKPSISVMDVVSGRKWVLVSTGLTLPNALVIDFTEEIMLWADASTHQLERASLDGTNRRVLYTSPGAHYFGMALSPTHFYITDWNKHYVEAVNRETYVLTTQTPIAFAKPMGIAVYYSTSNSTTGERQTHDINWQKYEL